jgi:hypothetical protein
MLDITTLAAWGEFIGGIAVVVSLIYLAGQIRQNSRLLQISTTASVADADNLMSSLAVQDTELIRIYDDGARDRAAISEADGRVFDWYLEMVYRSFLRNYQFAKAGVIDDAVWELHVKAHTLQLRQPGIRQLWAEIREIYPDEFCAFVDGLIREGETAE